MDQRVKKPLNVENFILSTMFSKQQLKETLFLENKIKLVFAEINFNYFKKLFVFPQKIQFFNKRNSFG